MEKTYKKGRKPKTRMVGKNLLQTKKEQIAVLKENGAKDISYDGFNQIFYIK